jgi:UDP-N-acetylmuramoyl-tripeptide--D-alanyl-D-alanine ligase
MKKLLQLKLKLLAKLILAKYQPDVVGITGSVGKTSAKEAIYAVLSVQYKNRRSVKNYNNEIGLPLTIIGVDSPGRSVWGWFLVFAKAFGLILFKDKNYPEILILEMGVDRPGDMAYLQTIAKPKIGVVTLIGSSHIEFFGSIEKIKEEKIGLIKKLPKNGWAIINGDDARLQELMSKDKQILAYGFDDKANLRAEDMQISFAKGEIQGTSFKMRDENSVTPILLPKVLGQAAVYAALAGAAVGKVYGINPIKIAQALGKFKAPNGRLKLLNGIKDTLIIDDTYNSSPQSSAVAMEILNKIGREADGRKIAVLGDMLELGNYSEEAHQEIGKIAVKMKIDKLYVIGERSRDIARGAEQAGMLKDDIFHFRTSDEAKKFIQERIRPNDIILIKGSQGMRMEKIVKEIMAEPMRAEELLVRQGREWDK